MSPSRAAGEPMRRRILQFIGRSAERGAPPTVREIAEAVGLRSPATVQRHLRTLEEEGRIRRTSEGRSRSWQVVGGRRGAPMPAEILVVGRIAAGSPIESAEAGEESLPLSPEAFASSGDVVALRVEGNSMTEAGILSGDYAIVRRQPEVENGQVAAVTIDGEGTLKVWRRRGRRIDLEPRARGFEVIQLGRDSGEVRVFGRLVGVARVFDEA